MKFNEFRNKFKNPTYIVASCDWWPSKDKGKSIYVAKVITVKENKDIDCEIDFYLFDSPYASNGGRKIRNSQLVDDLNFNIISEDKFNTLKLLYVNK